MRFLTEILAKAGITSNYVQLDTLAATPGGAPGRIVWNDVDGTLEFQMKGGNVTQQIGQELPVLVKHADNTGLTNGKVVYQFSSDGSNVTVKYASASSEATASKTFGVMTEDATGGAKGFCTTFGYVRNINTSALTEGAMIWLSETPGEMTTTRPTQPAHGVVVGRCIRQHATEGVIFVSIQNGFELDEIHDVLITSKANNDFIVYESATNLWKNKTISAVLGYTPANGANYLALTGGTLTGDLTLSGVNPRLYFTDTDNNPDYFISNTDGTFTVYDVTNSVGRFKIYSTGNAEFTNEITALSANLNGSTNAYLNLNAANAGGNEAGVYFKIGGTAKWEQYTAANDANLTFWNNGGGIRFYLTPSGGASFAGSITAGGIITVNTALGFRINGSSESTLALNNTGGGTEWRFNSYTNGNLYFQSGGGATNAVYFTSAGAGVFSSSLITASELTTGGNIYASNANIKLYTFQNVAGQYRYIGTEYAAGNGNNKAEIRFVIDGGDTKTKITFHTANGGGQINEVMGVFATGQFKLNNYTTSSSFSGTAAGYLAFDSSGNVITVAGVAATDNTKLPLAGGTMTGLLAFSNVTGNKIDFYHTTTGSGDRYGVQVQNSELRIHSGAGGDGSGGITFGKSTTTTFTEALRVRNDGNVLLANTGTLILGIDDNLDRTNGVSRTRLQLAPPSHTGAEWTFVTYDDSSNAYLRIGYGNGAASFQMRHDGYTTIAGNVLIHSANIGSYTAGSASSVAWSGVTGKPTTLSGYGITDSLYQASATIDVNAFNSTGLYRGSTSGWSNRPTVVHNGGALLNIDTHPGGYYAQLFFDSGGNRIYMRSADAYTWQSWVTIINSGNYSSYSPTLTGGGASGTWSINVTGTANNITAYTINQSVGTGNAPTFADVYTNGWFRNNTNNAGLYSQANNVHFSSSSDGRWNIGSGGRTNGALVFYQDHMTTLKGYVYWDGSGFGLLNNQGGWSVLAYQGTSYGGELRGTWTMAGNTIWTSSNAPRAGNSNLMYYAGFTLDANTMPSNSTGFTYAVNAPYTGPIAKFSEDGYALQLNATYSGGNNFAYRTRNGDAGSWNAWKEVLHSSNYSSYALARGGDSTTGVFYFKTNNGGYCGSLSNASMQAYSDSNNSAFLSFHKGGYYAVNMGLDADNVLRIGGWSAGANRWQLDMSGNQTVAGNVTASLDVYSNNGWFYSNNNAGWYNNTYGQGLRQSKANVSYGNVITVGENYNGWSGYNTTNTYVTCFMQNSAGDHGFYQEGGGAGWTFFFNKGNHCAGIGTDNTWSGDGLRVVKQISAEYGFTTWSDRRAKENISPIVSALDKVLSMRGVYFNYIKDQAKTKRVGFIAQELQAVLPEVVNYAEEIDEYNVNYGQVVSLLTEGIKEQQAIIVSQNSKIERLEALVEQLINK